MGGASKSSKKKGPRLPRLGGASKSSLSFIANTYMPPVCTCMRAFMCACPLAVVSDEDTRHMAHAEALEHKMHAKGLLVMGKDADAQGATPRRWRTSPSRSHTRTLGRHEPAATLALSESRAH